VLSETSVTNYHYILGNIPEERRSYSRRGRSLKYGLRTKWGVCVSGRMYRHLQSLELFGLSVLIPNEDRGCTVVKVLCYKSEGRWFDRRWCHWNFSLT